MFTSSKITFSIVRNIVEFKPSIKCLGQFHYYAANHKIKLLECNFTGNDNRQQPVMFNVQRVWKEILLQQCNFHRSSVILNVGNKTLEHNVVSAVIYQVENSTFYGSLLNVLAYSYNSFALINYSHVLLDQSSLNQHDTEGYVGLYFENCTFLNIYTTAIISLQTSYMNISHCYFKLIESPFCVFEGCAIQAQGRVIRSDMVMKLFFPACRTHCKIGVGNPETNTFIIKTIYLSLVLKQCQFTTGNQNRSSTEVAFVNSVAVQELLVTGTIFDASKSVAKNHIFIMVSVTLTFAKYIKTHILCPETKKAVAVASRHHLYSYIVSCREACEIDEYTYDGGNMIINGALNSYNSTNSLTAKCEGSIKSLPNYWGYKNYNNPVVMIRCPDEYCCQNEHTCHAISSCQKGRTGILCGSCIENLTESLISPKCIDSSTCHTVLVLTMYFLAALSYAVGILTIDSIKRKTRTVKKTTQTSQKKNH